MSPGFARLNINIDTSKKLYENDKNIDILSPDLVWTKHKIFTKDGAVG